MRGFPQEPARSPVTQFEDVRGNVGCIAGEARSFTDGQMRIVHPVPEAIGHTLAVQGITPLALGRSLDPFFMVDRFAMQGRAYPPHPYAGFSTLTYVLPESPGALSTRDSRGDCSTIRPGGAHWTSAGSGILQEELPVSRRASVRGFKFFVNSPACRKSDPPVSHHVAPDLIPVVPLGDGWVRVVAGRYAGLQSGVPLLSEITLLDVRLPEGMSFAWDDARCPAQFAAIVDGSGCADAEALRRDDVVAADEDGRLRLRGGTGAGLRFVFAAGEPLREEVVWLGPFAMATEADARAAHLRHSRGEMGHLEPAERNRATATA